MPRDVADQTWRWLVQTGRISGEAERIVQDMDLDTFLDAAAQQWEAAGCPRYMQGMKDVMLRIIWP